MNYGQMQNQSWSRSGKDFVTYDENDVEPDDTIINQLKEESEEEEEEQQQTLRPANTLKPGVMDRKSYEPGAREQIHK